MIHNVELSGPTYFNPLIQESLKVCNFKKVNNPNEYSILLILTGFLNKFFFFFKIKKKIYI